MPLQSEDFLCILCGANEATLFKRLHDRLTESLTSYLFMRCKQCSLISMQPTPSIEEIGRFYPENYGAYKELPRIVSIGSSSGLRYHVKKRLLSQKGILGKLLFEYFVRWNSNWRWYYAARPSGLKSRRFLDVGCGSGSTVAFFQSFGWGADGLEPSRAASQKGKDAGLNVFQGTIDSIALTEDSYDLIWMSHVLEHLPNPLESLRKVKKLLTASGKVYLEIPIIDAGMVQIFKDDYFGWECPRHLYQFTEKTIREMAGKAGFNIKILSRHSVAAHFAWSLALWRESHKKISHTQMLGELNKGATGVVRLISDFAAALLTIFQKGEVISAELS